MTTTKRTHIVARGHEPLQLAPRKIHNARGAPASVRRARRSLTRSGSCTQLDDAMNDYTIFLWVLKLGAVANLYFLVNTAAVAGTVDTSVVIPAQILFVVSAYRCLFPVR